MVSPDPISPDNSGRSEPLQDGSPTDPGQSRRRWTVVLLIAVAAGLISWGIGETPLVRVDAEEANFTLVGQKLRGATAATIEAAQARTATKVFSIFGAILGLGAGIAGSVFKGSSNGGRTAAILGLIGGGAVGGLAALLVVPLHSRLVYAGTSELVTSFVVHGGIWGPIGFVVGLALGLGLGRGRKCTFTAIIGGVLGALLAAIAFELMGALIFPLDGTGLPISVSTESRLLARLLVAVLTIPTALAFAIKVSQETGAKAISEVSRG